MPFLSDLPLTGDFLAREAQRKALLTAASAGSSYQDAASSPVPNVAPPAAPSLLAHSMATLGSNLASALSGNNMYSENTARSQMEDQAQFAQAQEQYKSLQFQRNRDIHQGILEQRRDAYMQAAEAARDAGNHVQALDLQSKAAADAKALAQMQEEAANTRTDKEIKARHQDIATEMAGRLAEIQAGKGKTGIPRLDQVLSTLKMKREAEETETYAYYRSAGKNATPKGLKDYLAKSDYMQATTSTINRFAPQLFPKNPNESPEVYAASLHAGKIDDETIQEALKGNYSDDELKKAFGKGSTGPAPIQGPKNQVKMGGLLGKIQDIQNAPRKKGVDLQTAILLKLLTGL